MAGEHLIVLRGQLLAAKNGLGGPLLAAKNGLGGPLLAPILGLGWDHFWQGGTTFGRGTLLAAKSGLGGLLLAAKSGLGEPLLIGMTVCREISLYTQLYSVQLMKTHNRS